MVRSPGGCAWDCAPQSTTHGRSQAAGRPDRDPRRGSTIVNGTLAELSSCTRRQGSNTSRSSRSALEDIFLAIVVGRGTGSGDGADSSNDKGR
jgi:hypothetical protein